LGRSRVHDPLIGGVLPSCSHHHERPIGQSRACKSPVGGLCLSLSSFSEGRLGRLRVHDPRLGGFSSRTHTNLEYFTLPHMSPWGVRAEAMWILWGVCGDSVWSPYGFCVDSVRTPCGFHVDSMQSPWIKFCRLHVDYLPIYLIKNNFNHIQKQVCTARVELLAFRFFF
jgi:hypothetical protein